MAWDSDRFEDDLGAAMQRFDAREAERLCRALIDQVRCQAGPYDAGAADRILKKLQRKRYFDLQVEVADAFQQAGLQAPAVGIRYAQALLDLGRLSAAVPYLERLVEATAATGEAFENTEARGLLGRACKQVYVDLDNPASEGARHAINAAIGWYHAVYADGREANSWHGINTVAMLVRAAVDRVAVDAFPEPAAQAKTLAQEILAQMSARWNKRAATMWDCGTALEACIALDEHALAREWLHRYVREPAADAFELASTLRQLEQVWRLTVDAEPGTSLLPVLRAELLQREGGGLTVRPEQLKAGSFEDAAADKLEKILGKQRYVSYKFMLRAVERSRAVARVEHQPGQGFGTGFVLRGRDLHDALGDEWVLLTNSHVVSDDPGIKDALRPEDAIITFQLLLEEGKADEEYSVAELLWSSPPGELDATVLRLDSYPDGFEAYPVAPRLPLADGDQRVYVIGHPEGGSLSFSIQDNLLLDHEAPRLHYRAPTTGGSSGSPVFNAQWKLIGIHHAGDREMLRLNGKPGTYAANEGLWIQSIRERMQADPQRIGQRSA